MNTSGKNEDGLQNFKIDPSPYYLPAKRAKARIDITGFVCGSYCVILLLFNSLFENRALFILFLVALPQLLLLFYFIKNGDPYIEAHKSAIKLFDFCTAASDAKPIILWLRSFNSELVTENIDVSELQEYEYETPRGYAKKGKRYKRKRIYEDNVLTLLTIMSSHHIVAINDVRSSNISGDPLLIISSSESWEQTFHLLIEVADAIIVIPELSASLRTEMTHIIDRYLPKTLFAMPHTINRKSINLSPNQFLSGETRNTKWDQVIRSLELSFPSYKEAGAFLNFSNVQSAPTPYPYSETGIKEALSKICGDGSLLPEILIELKLKNLLSDTYSALETELRVVKRVRLRRTS
jgi:hypothetical protein